MVCQPLPALSCTYSNEVPPYERLEERITVEVTSQAQSGEVNSVSVAGGEVPATETLNEPITVGEAQPDFGVEKAVFSPEEADGSATVLAGVHPFQLTTELDFNQILAADPGKGLEPSAPALVRDLNVKLPPGLVGDPQATPQCSDLDFSTELAQDTNLCPADTAVGAALVTINEPQTFTFATEAVPVFNLVPAPGEPARFGFEVFRDPVIFDTSVKTGGEYNVEVNVRNASQVAQVLGAQVTFWGEPGDVAHDPSRGWACIQGGHHALLGEHCQPPDPRPTLPLLIMPTSCEGPLSMFASGDSWTGETLSAQAGVPALRGCGELPFGPSIAATTETRTASTPTGLQVTVSVPQETTLQEHGRAEADLKDTTVTLPAGLEANPSAANGLSACSETQIGYTGQNPGSWLEEFAPGAPACPSSSKIGTVHIKTPLLPAELEGSLYLAQPAPNGEAGQNPFGSLLAFYLVAEDPKAGVLVKLAGKASLNEQTDQITTSFENTPQLPFEELRLELFGGPRASLSTPALCQAYPVDAQFTPWSGTPEAPGTTSSSSAFEITSGPDGGGCPASLAFNPSFDAQSTSLQAGAFTQFVLNLVRPDGDQALDAISMHLPAGVAAILANVTPCREPPPGSEWACGPDSLLGYANEAAGLGPEPYRLTGQVYLTTGYDEAPYGLLVQTPAVAGPFNLGMVNVRSRIDVDPHTAQVTIATDPGPRHETVPTSLRGIPVQLKALQVVVNRPQFEYNPTNCDPTSITGTLSGAEGANANVSSPFQVQGCPRAPVQTVGHGGQSGQDQQSRRRQPQAHLQIHGWGSARRKDDPDDPRHPAGPPHDHPESLHRRHLRKQSRGLSGRLGYRRRHRSHPRPEKPTQRPDLSRLAR